VLLRLLLLLLLVACIVHHLSIPQCKRSVINNERKHFLEEVRINGGDACGDLIDKINI